MPHQLGVVDNDRAPHCDELVLHAPGTCNVCDECPGVQQERIEHGIAFTNEEVFGSSRSGADLDPCPATLRRYPSTINAWSGNRPYRDVDHEGDDGSGCFVISHSEYDKLLASALRIREASIPELSDEEAGRWLKKRAVSIEKAWKRIGHEDSWGAEDQIMVELAIRQAIQWVKMCIQEGPRARLRHTLENVTFSGRSEGDWEIIVRRRPWWKFWKV